MATFKVKAPNLNPIIEVYDQGVFIVKLLPWLELRGVLIDKDVHVAWFSREKPLTDAVIVSKN